MQALEDHEDALSVLRLDADAVVGESEQPGASSTRAIRDHRRRLPPRNFSALPIRFWNSGSQQRQLGQHEGQMPARVDGGAGLRRSGAPRLPGACGERGVAETTGSRRRRWTGRPAEREQVVDQHLHALGAVDGELDVLVGPRVELAAVALLQQLAEARDLAQRLLQVVRGDVGELLELGVGALQLRAAWAGDGVRRARSRAAPARCARASRRSRSPSRAISRGPRTGRPRLELTAGDSSRLPRQPRSGGYRRPQAQARAQGCRDPRPRRIRLAFSASAALFSWPRRRAGRVHVGLEPATRARSASKVALPWSMSGLAAVSRSRLTGDGRDVRARQYPRHARCAGRWWSRAAAGGRGVRLPVAACSAAQAVGVGCQEVGWELSAYPRTPVSWLTSALSSS